VRTDIAAIGETLTQVERAADLAALVGTTLGTSPWIEISQTDINDFARVTRDQQWIHVDRERAASGPFGTTIAHGYFVLSLCAYFSAEAFKVRYARAAIN
jgi:acyl dehydratase